MPKTSVIETQCADCHLKIRQKWQNIIQQRQNIFISIRNVIDLLSIVQKIITENQLYKWKCYQTLAGYGDRILNASVEEMLHQMQNWFEDLAKLICDTRSLINWFIHNPFNQPNITDESEIKAYNDINKLFESLISSSFIVEVQPPQVIKRDSVYVI